MDYTQLISAAVKASENSYSPYSGFKVGAALLTQGGKIYCGCNVENSSFSATNCAERTAFFTAVANRERSFEAIAITCSADSYPFPCGVCRQVMAEFCDSDFKIIVAKSTEDYAQFTLGEILPHSFELEKKQ